MRDVSEALRTTVLSFFQFSRKQEVIDFVVSRNNRGFTESLYHWFIQTSVIFESEVLRFYLLFVAFLRHIWSVFVAFSGHMISSRLFQKHIGVLRFRVDKIDGHLGRNLSPQPLLRTRDAFHHVIPVLDSWPTYTQAVWREDIIEEKHEFVIQSLLVARYGVLPERLSIIRELLPLFRVMFMDQD
jgi:hypothetical protein